MTPDQYDSRMRLPLDDMYLLTARDKQLFIAYLENVAGRGDRWAYVTTDGTRYDGGIHAGEETLEAIAKRFNEWWPTRRSLY